MTLFELQQMMDKFNIINLNVKVSRGGELNQYHVDIDGIDIISTSVSADLELAVNGAFNSSIGKIDDEIATAEAKLIVLRQKKEELTTEAK